MTNMRPDVFFLGSLLLLWFGLWLGSRARRARAEIVEGEGKIISLLEGASLTLFGLLMGFTFSMAVSHFDRRDALVVNEANAIGTTWRRTATLDEPVRSEQQNLLRQYVPVRLSVVSIGEADDSTGKTADLQARLWANASSYAAEHRDAVTGLYLSALNDSITVSLQRTAADEDRIPGMAWTMLLFVGFVATTLVGMDVKSRSRVLQVTLPLVLAATLGMTLDMDSPSHGWITIDTASMQRVAQQVAGSLPQQAP